MAAPAEAEALPPAQSGSATSMRGSSTRSLGRAPRGRWRWWRWRQTVVETLGSFGTTVTGSLVKSASDMTPMCDEPVCCVNVIVNGNVVSIGFSYLTQKDPTQMCTAIARHSPSTPLAHLTMPPQSAVLAHTSHLRAPWLWRPSRLRLLLRPGPPVDAARDYGSYAAASAPQTCEPAVLRAVRG